MHVPPTLSPAMGVFGHNPTIVAGVLYSLPIANVLNDACKILIIKRSSNFSVFSIGTLTNAEIKLNTTSRLGTSGCQPKRLRRRGKYVGGSTEDSREKAEGPTKCELPGHCTRQASRDRCPTVQGHTQDSGDRGWQGVLPLSNRVVTEELDKRSYVALARGGTCRLQKSREPREDLMSFLVMLHSNGFWEN